MKQQTRSRPAAVLTAVAVALAVALSAGAADARAGKGGSGLGSRGSRTFDAPAATPTAPNAAAPIDRSMAAPAQPGFNQGMARPAPASGGFFSRGGFMGAVMGGLIGAGIAGLLFGGGFFEGLGSIAGFLGFALQALLVVFLVRMAIRYFRNRSRPAYAGGNPRTSEPPRGPDPVRAYDIPAAGGSAAPRPGAGGQGAARDEVGIGEADYKDFERLLGTVQTAYGREDLPALREVATPEMVSYFAEELADDTKRGVVNKLSDVHLLQGDLAEAWREGDAEYATVALRFSLIDQTVDRASGRVVDGSAEKPVEATEVWTFTRSRGGRWRLSAIQQA